MNKPGRKAGVQRGDRRRFPAEPRLNGGLGASVLGSVADGMGAVVETLWPDLERKLPPT
jgi:hypothetical protein